MYTLNITTEFSAAHRLVGYPGVCQNIHGHNWKVSMSVFVEQLDKLGMAADMAQLLKYLNKVVDPFDHKLINDIKPFDEVSPTSENLARYFFEELLKEIPAFVNLQQIGVQESENFVVTYKSG
jgi:6-pyruvoyltetrahydropterin/6-carboxytetrahydropterin synthase